MAWWLLAPTAFLTDLEYPSKLFYLLFDEDIIVSSCLSFFFFFLYVFQSRKILAKIHQYVNHIFTIFRSTFQTTSNLTSLAQYKVDYVNDKKAIERGYDWLNWLKISKIANKNENIIMDLSFMNSNNEILNQARRNYIIAVIIIAAIILGLIPSLL